MACNDGSKGRMLRGILKHRHHPGTLVQHRGRFWRCKEVAAPILHGKSGHFTYYEFDGSVLRPILLVVPCRGKIKHYLRQNQL